MSKREGKKRRKAEAEALGETSAHSQQRRPDDSPGSIAAGSALDSGASAALALSGATGRAVRSQEELLAPVFIHSSFRTCSTWLWAKLRSLHTTIAFYEIFNEALATIDAAELRANKPSKWGSKHPSSAPYFFEFMSLLNAGGGVIGFDKAMAFERFIPADGVRGHLTAAEQDYVSGLIRHAVANRKVPVLTATRSLGRVSALRESFAGKHVLCHRNIFHQWASYSKQATSGNSFFMETIAKTIAACGHDPIIRAIDQWFGARTNLPDDEETFTAFVVLHLYLSAMAFEAADLAIDATALPLDRDYRRSIERDLSDMVHASVDLSDATSSFELSIVVVQSKTVFIDTIEQFSKLISGACRTREGVAFLVRMRDAALAEWERHDFYTKSFVALQSEKPRALEPPIGGGQANDDGQANDARLRDAVAAKETAEGKLAAMEAKNAELASRLRQETLAHRATAKALVKTMAKTLAKTMATGRPKRA